MASASSGMGRVAAHRGQDLLVLLEPPERREIRDLQGTHRPGLIHGRLCPARAGTRPIFSHCLSVDSMELTRSSAPCFSSAFHASRPELLLEAWVPTVRCVRVLARLWLRLADSPIHPPALVPVSILSLGLSQRVLDGSGTVSSGPWLSSRCDTPLPPTPRSSSPSCLPGFAITLLSFPPATSALSPFFHPPIPHIGQTTHENIDNGIR